MKARLSMLARWWIAVWLVALAIVVFLEPGLFLGDMQAACDSNMLLSMRYCAMGLMIMSFLLFMLTNHNGSRAFWVVVCIVLWAVMVWRLLATDAGIFFALSAMFALGAGVIPTLPGPKSAAKERS